MQMMKINYVFKNNIKNVMIIKKIFKKIYVNLYNLMLITKILLLTKNVLMKMENVFKKIEFVLNIIMN